MTLAIPDELMAKMKKIREIRWSEVARKAIEKKVSEFEIIEKIAQKSRLTKKDVEEISKKIKSVAAKRFNEDIAGH